MSLLFSHRASLNLLFIFCPFTQGPASFLMNDPANEMDKHLLITTEPMRKKKPCYWCLVDLSRERHSVWTGLRKLDRQNRSHLHFCRKETDFNKHCMIKKLIVFQWFGIGSSRIDYFCDPAEPIAENSLSNDFSCRSFTGASNTGMATQLRDWSWVFDKQMLFTGWHGYNSWLNSCKIDSACNTLLQK